MKEYCYFIENQCERINYYITDTCDELKTISKMDMYLQRKDDHWYECYAKLYDDELPYVEQLKLFRADFNKWSEECKSVYPEGNFNHFHPKAYNTNNNMIMCFYKKYGTTKLKEYNPDPIDFTESYYSEKTPNSGIQVLAQQGLMDSWGYDFSAYYAHIMGDSRLNFYFPIKSGKQTNYTLDKLLSIYRKNKNKPTHQKLPFGYYMINIKSTHPDVIKVFNFSAKSCYTHTSVIFAFQYKQIYKFEFEMVDNVEYNAYIYADKDIVKSSDMFGLWFEKTEFFKKQLPQNKLIKYLSKGLWGRLTQFNREFITEDELLERNDVSIKEDSTKPYYLLEWHNNKSIEIVNKSSLYKHNLARIKSFITAYTRDYIARLIIKEKIHDKVIRVYTDNITLTEPHEFTTMEYVPISEKKTTGKIYWKSCSTYFFHCSQCNQFYKYCPTGCVGCNNS